MTTTAIFVEILIIGLEACIWIALLLDVNGIQYFRDVLKGLDEYSALITLLIVAAAYVIGIFVDRIADSFYKNYRYETKTPASVGKMRLLIMKESEGMTKFLEYQRSRLRIARATVFNLIATMLAGFFWIIKNDGLNQNGDVTAFGMAMILIGMVILYYACITVQEIDKAQMGRMIDAYKIIIKEKEERGKDEDASRCGYMLSTQK